MTTFAELAELLNKKSKEQAHAIREAQIGKVGPKRNVIKTKSGILRDKSGKAVKTGKGTAAYKRMMEKRKNR